MALFAEEGMLPCSLRVTQLGLVLFLWIGGGCFYYHPSCNLRFVSSCKANASHGAVRGRGDVVVQSVSAVQSASDATRVSAFSVDRWRLFVLPFFVQLEIRVGLQLSEYCRYEVDC